MAIRRKTAKLENLAEVTTLVSESGLTSEIFNIADIPSQLPVGKSSILIMGSRLLRENVVLKMELLDSSGNPIYLEPVNDYSESGGVRVSIEIYDTVSPGTATLTILGELNPTEYTGNIPEQFRNKYNVKHTVPLTINLDIPNDRPIRFYKRPKLTISEVVKGQLTVTNATSGSNTQSLGVVAGKAAPGTEGKSFNIDESRFGEVPTYTDKNFGFSPIGNYDRQESTKKQYTFVIDGNTFKPEMVGGTITIASPVGNPGFRVTDTQVSESYSSRITKVVNSSTIEVQKPFGLRDSSTGKHVVSSMEFSAYSIVYPKTSEFEKSVVNFRSFADIQISDARTFSGDVNRIAGYVKNNGPYGNWTKIIDTPVEAPELLVDESSTTGTTRIGRFISDSAFTTYFTATKGRYGKQSSATLGTSSDPEYLSDSLFVSSSGIDMLVNEPRDWITIELKPAYSMSFKANTEYTLKANLVLDHRNENNTIQDAKAVFHLSGSAFGLSTTNGDRGYGRAIGRKVITSASSAVYGTDNPEFETTFTPDSEGTAVLQVRFTAGHWHVSDISIRPNSTTNFSPEFIRLVAPVPPLQRRPDNLDFAFEFYDVNNNKSSTVVTSLPDNPDGVVFNGENLNILGDDNSIGGSLFLGGDATGSGVQMGGVDSRLPETGERGATASGFIRSVQYQGFTSASQAGDNTGFMIYSGSVLPDSGDGYAGVGLELVGESGSFRFGTNPSRFEVVADAFFVGNTSSQFISGSGGIIEISSSAFHLSSSGDVVISGSVTATSGDIGGWQIIDNKLSGSNATLDATGAAIYKSDEGPDTNPNDGYYIDFTPSNSNPFYVRFGPDFAVSSSGKLIASGALIEGVVTASGGLIANWVIGSDTISKSTGGTFTGLSSTGDTRFFAGASSLTNSGSAAFNVKSNGDISGSQVLFTGGKIGGFVLTDSILRNANNTVELSSTLPGLKIKDAGGTSRVEVKSGSLSTVGGGTQYIGNKSFEDDLSGLSAGRNFVNSITSWSFVEGGSVNISLTDRNAYSDDNQAVSGRVTLDVVVPAGSGNYSSNNTYELSQVITASISQGDTLSFSSVARFSSSFGGRGKDRALGPQYFRAEFLSASAWHPFLPANEFTASNGYGEYFLGSGQYASFGASAEIPVSTTHVRLVLTGSINDDSGFSIEKPLFVGDKGTVNADISGKKFTKTVVGSTSPEYPETEITFDNFSLRSNTRKVEMTQEGLLIYNSEDSFLKMTGAGIEFRGGSGLASFGQSINRETFTNDSQIAGTLAAPALQPYTSDPEDIGTSASDGNVAEFAKGNHRHRLTSGTLDTVLASTNFSSSVQGRFINLTAGTGLTGGGSSGNITVNVVGGTGITANANDIAVDSSVIRNTGAQSIGGVKTFTDEIQANGGLDVTGAVTASTNVSASLTGSFGHILINGSPLQAATGTNTGDVTLAGSRNYITLGANQVITVNEVDISDDTNLTGGTGITLTGDTLSTTDSEIVHDNLSGFVANEHVDHSTVSISAGSGLTGGGTILANRTIHVGQGTGITVNSNDISTNDSEIVHDNLSGFVANEHIDHSGVSIVAGSGLTGGGTIESSRTLNIGAGTGIDVAADSISVDVSDFMTNGANNRVLTATGTDAMNAEANLTFDSNGLLINGGDYNTSLRIKSGGNAGGIQFLNSSGAVTGYVYSQTGGEIGFLDGDSQWAIKHDTDSSTEFRINNTTYMTLNTSGLNLTGNITLSGTVDGRDLATDGSKLDNIAVGADNFSSWTIGGDSGTSTVGSGQTATIAGTAPISTAESGRTVTISIDADGITDTHLQYNTGQHLTTSSTPTFAGLTSTGTISVGGGSIQKQGTHDLSLHSVKHISFDWDANYDSYEYHGISSRDGSGNFSDDLTIASFDDIHMRVDSNNNDSPAFMNMYNNTHNSATYFGKWGYDGTNYLLYHSGRVGIGTETPGVALEVIGNISGSATSTGSFGNIVVTDTDMAGSLRLAGGGGSRILFNNLRSIEASTDGSALHIGEDYTSIRMRADIRPESNNSHDLGTSSFYWKNLYLNGNIIVNGTVDGRDVASDGSKLDGIESGATADQTITAGSGLTGGGTGNVTLNVGAGTGIDVAADAISVDVSDFMTNGSNDRIVTATGTDGMNAEANLTFNGNALSVTSAADPILVINKTGGNNAAIHFQAAGAAKAYIYSDANGVLKLGNTTTNPVLTLNTNGTIAIASTIDGRDLATDGSKLDGIESGATADQTASEIRTLVEAASDSNVFTDADHSKLNAIESGATADQTITAGTGLDGGGTGDVTLSVDVSDFMTNGSDNRVLTATGTDAMNAEANLTYNSSNGQLQITSGNSGALFAEYSSGMTLWLDGSNGDFAGGDYFGIHAYGTTDLAFSYAGNTRMTIKSGGNVGIGTASPTAGSAGNAHGLTPLLHLYSNTSGADPTLHVSCHDTDEASLLLTENSTSTYTNAWGSRIFYDGATSAFFNIEIGDANTWTHRFSIDRYGKVAIGGGKGNTFSQLLYVAGTGRFTGNVDFDSGIDVTGNITVTGTVDGRDLATDGSKLDGIEANAKNDQTITAGSGLTGGGTGDVTLNVGAGTGIDVAADAISVDVSDFMSNGSNNRVLTATGTDAMNAESGLVFDGSNLGINTTGPETALTIDQSADDNGIRLYGYDDVSSYYGEIFIDSSGYLNIDAGTNRGVEIKGHAIDFWVNSGGTHFARMTYDGKFGIGTTSPDGVLHVSGALGDAYFEGYSTSGRFGGIQFINTAGNGDVVAAVNVDRDGANDAGALTFDTQPAGGGMTEAMRVTSAQRVGIGTSTPEVALHVQTTDQVKFLVSEGSADQARILRTGTSAGIFDVYDNDGSTIAIRLMGRSGYDSYFNAGNLGIGTTSPGNLLHVEAAKDSDWIAKFKNTGTTNAYGVQIDTSANTGAGEYSLGVYTGANTGLFVTSDAKVGIGTASPAYALDVTGGASETVNMGTLRLDNGFTLAERAGSTYANLGSWIQVGSIGLYSATVNSAHIYPNSASDYGAWRINGTRNGWNGITFETGGVYNTLMSNASTMGFYNDTDNEWMISANRNGDVKLYYDSAEKLATTSTGVSVTGTLNASNVNTGLGATEVYLMNQNVRTSDSVTFAGVSSTNNVQVQANGFFFSTGAVTIQSGTGNNIALDAGTGADEITLSTTTLASTVDVTIADGEGLSTTSFTSGFAGSGYRIDQGITATGKTSAEFDNLTVRGTMSIYELLVQQVRATNGNLFISSTGKIDSVSESGGTYTLGVDTGEGSGHGFAAGDVIRMQRFNNTGTGASVTISDLTVQAVSSTGSFTAILSGSSTAPAAGFEYVRLGNTTSSSRQGGIYLTADDSNAPFIDVFDEITEHSDFNTAGKTKTRMGKLSGITSPRFGALSGFGFWASGSVYLEGNVNATAGNIGGWAIAGNAITSSAGIISIDANTKRITITDGTNDRIYLGEITGSSTYGLKIFDGNGTTDSDLLVELGSTRNQIVGWDLTPGNIVSDNEVGSVRLSSTAQALTIWTGSVDETQPKLVVGKLPLHDGTVDTPYGFAVFSGSGTVSGSEASASVLITANKARIAGWELVPGQLKSGTVARIDGNQATIALGANAHQTHTSAQDNLFYVSASATPTFFVGSNFSFINNVLTAAGWTVSSAAIEKDDVKLTSATNGSYLGIGATAFEGAGIFIGQTAASTYKMSMSGSAGGMFWDNTKLSVKGANATTVFETTTTGATIGGWDITGTTISKNQATLNSAGTIFLGAGTAYQADDTIFLDGANERMSIGSGFFYDGNSLTVNNNATIASWSITSTAITKGQVSLQATTTKPGLHITDGTDTILTVVSSSTGLTDVNSLTGSAANDADATNANNDFSLGTNNTDISTNSVNGNWFSDTITWDTDSGASQSEWKYSTSDAEINTQVARLAPGVTTQTYGSIGYAGFYKDFVVEQGVVSLSAFVKAIGWKYYGDFANVKSFVNVQVTGSTASGITNGTQTNLFSKMVPHAATKLTNVSFRFKNPNSTYYIRVRFTAVQEIPSSNKAKQMTLGGYVVDGIKIQGLGGSAGTGATKARTKPLIELTQDGLFMFSNKDSFMRLDDDGFAIKGDIDASDVNASGDVTISGSLNTLNELNISGSVNFSPAVGIALGHEIPEGKIHASESFDQTDGTAFYPDTIAQGNQPSWRKAGSANYSDLAPGLAGDGTDSFYLGSVFKASFNPFLTPGNDAADTGQYGTTAAYGTGHIYDSYGRLTNCALAAEMITGIAEGYASTAYQMSGSVMFGANKSYDGNKNMWGAQIAFAMPPGNTNKGNCRQRGIQVVQMNGGTIIDNISGVSTYWGQIGYEVVRQGTINANVDAATGGYTQGGFSAFRAENNSDGTYGASAGYGIYLKDYAKHYFSGQVGIGDTQPSYELDVTGEIRATGNIIAYSDARHKDNIETVTNAIEIVNDLRGVRFNWTKEYQEEKKSDKYYNGKKIHENVLEKRQVGLIAQEVQEVLPELVSEDGDGFLSVNYANLVAVLVEANKEQQKLIEDLQERVKALENK